MNELEQFMTYGESITMKVVVFSLLLAFVLTQAVSAVYVYTFRGMSYSRSFVQAVALGSVVAAMLMLAINNSVAAGLDYVGVSPILSNLSKTGRVRFESASDTEVIDALSLTIEKEGLIPALESSHGFVEAFKDAPKFSKDDAILINQSGRGDKDIFTVADAFDDPKWRQFIQDKAAEYAARGEDSNVD